MHTLNSFSHVAEHRRACDRLESAQLPRRGQIHDENEEQNDENGSENREKNRRRVGDHDEHRYYAAQHYQKEAERVRHHEVDQVNVLREAVQNSSGGCRIKERHWCMQQAVWNGL